MKVEGNSSKNEFVTLAVKVETLKRLLCTQNLFAEDVHCQSAGSKKLIAGLLLESLKYDR